MVTRAKPTDTIASSDALKPFPEIVVLYLGLQIVDAKGAGWLEPEEGYTRGHMHKHADQEIALADLRCATEHQETTRRENPRGDDVLRHGRTVIKQLPE